MYYRILKVQEHDAKDPHFLAQSRWLRWFPWTTWRGNLTYEGATYRNTTNHKTMKSAEQIVEAMKRHHDPEHIPTVQVVWEGDSP